MTLLGGGAARVHDAVRPATARAVALLDALLDWPLRLAILVFSPTQAATGPTIRESR